MPTMYEIRTVEIDTNAHTAILYCRQLYNGIQNFEVESINENSMNALSKSLNKEENLYVTLDQPFDPEGNSVTAMIHTLDQSTMIPCTLLPIGE